MAIMIRQASDLETARYIARNKKSSGKVGYRHFVFERYAPNAKNGVQHVCRSTRSVISDTTTGLAAIDHYGKWEPLTASVLLIDGVEKSVIDLRIKSDYLK
jgi:hypothetical protein